MTLHGTNNAPNEQLDSSHQDPYAIQSEMILWYNYAASFKNQTEILIELYHWWTHLTFIISITIIKILVNITSMQYDPR